MCTKEGETRQERLTKKTTISLDSDPFGNLLFCPSIHGIGIWYWTSGHLIIKQSGISVEIKSVKLFKLHYLAIKFKTLDNKDDKILFFQLLKLKTSRNISRGDKVAKNYSLSYHKNFFQSNKMFLHFLSFPFKKILEKSQ